MQTDYEIMLVLADAPRSLQKYVAALKAENERLRNLLRRVHPIVQAHAGASHLLEGFRPKRNQWDELVDAIDAAMREGDEQ